MSHQTDQSERNVNIRPYLVQSIEDERYIELNSSLVGIIAKQV